MEEAISLDEKEYIQSKEWFSRKLAEWNEDVQLASRVLENDITAYKEVLEELVAAESNDLVGTSVSCIINAEFIHIKPEIYADEIVPNTRRKQLASGKLSESKMPVGQFNEIYQDYTCSVALKLAGDVFNTIPVEQVYVTCVAKMLNPETGHQEQTPILSVQFVRDTFASLKLQLVDPSDSMRNFNHNMNFKKTKGFSRIEALV